MEKKFKKYKLINKDNFLSSWKRNQILQPKNSFCYIEKFIKWLGKQSFNSLEECLRLYIRERFILKKKKIVMCEIDAIIIFFGLTSNEWDIEYINDILLMIDDCQTTDYLFDS